MLGEQGMSPCARASGGRVTTSNDSRSSRSARNLPLSTSAGRLLVGRGDDPHVDRDRPDAPIRVISPYSTARSSRSCAGIDRVPSSSRNKVPPSASSKRPWRVLDGAGEAARLVAEQLGLDQPRFMMTSGPPSGRWWRRSAQFMDRAVERHRGKASATTEWWSSARRSAPCRWRSRFGKDFQHRGGC
jgi:hypothetical protein